MKGRGVQRIAASAVCQFCCGIFTFRSKWVAGSVPGAPVVVAYPVGPL